MKFKNGLYKDIESCFVNSIYLKYILTNQEFIEDPDNVELISDINRQLKIRDMTQHHIYKDIVDPFKNKVWMELHESI